MKIELDVHTHTIASGHASVLYKKWRKLPPIRD